MKNFNEINWKASTQRFIELNHFKQPTPIQSAVIPMALKGKDIIGVSDTGTGKTHAFLIPLMEMIDPSKPYVQAVITAPTRELAQQIYRRAKLMSEANPNLRIKMIMGGIEKTKMAESLSVQPHLVIGTPGRIKDLFVDEGVLRIDTASLLVVDEADMTLEFGFLEEVDAIAGRMKDHLQMMVFSATIPQNLRPFLKKYMKNPQTIKINVEHQNNPQITHVLVPCKHRSYEETCLSILDGFMPYVCLIFANTREEASNCAKLLRENGKQVVEIHGGLESRQRKQAMKQLENLTQSYVVATDIAARGLDIEGITHVISMGFPSELDFYIHRSGRTGRAGRDGTCFALYKESDEPTIQTLKERGLVFEHKSYKNGQWQELKKVRGAGLTKGDIVEKEIARSLRRKNEKVKPGYKKKRAAEVQKIKQKRKREMIQNEIKMQRKERYKQQQRMKREGMDA